MDLVLQQLRSCFNPRAGTQIVGDEMVKISAKIDREANVRKDTVQIIATNISKIILIMKQLQKVQWQLYITHLFKT